MQDVAQRAGVSAATVSRVINGHTKVSRQTRHRVEGAIKALNYEPNVLGRNLRNAASRLLLVMLPSISNPFYTKIMNGIEDTAIKQGYNILLCETDSNPERETIYFNMVRNRLADGIILMDPTVDKERLHKLSNRYPVVQCSEFDETGSIPYVTIDNEKAAYQAVMHLISLGKYKIGLINSDEKFLYARQRRRGYEQALNESEIAVNKDWIYETSSLSFESGQQAIRKLLGLNNRPAAVFAVSDILAIGALKEIHSIGLHVPDDIALIGFDKIGFSNMTYPPLTTVSQPMYKMGCMAAEMIIRKIKGEKTESTLLDHELVIRGST